jgi:predicted nuclease of predicted toxin-antitoxin system
VKVKLDENIPARACERLVAAGLDADTAVQEGLGGRPDADVWAAAQRAGRFLVTQDLDFSDVRRFEPGSHHGLLLVRLPDAEQWRIADYVVGWLTAPAASTWERCFVVASPSRIRVLRPAER